MKLIIPAMLAAIAISQSAVAIDAADRSPYDKNPACLDRNVDSSKGDCIITDTGSPRHKYPPGAKAATTNPVTPSTPAAPAAREAAPASMRKGS
jgi:hypothetical protein